MGDRELAFLLFFFCFANVISVKGGKNNIKISEKKIEPKKNKKKCLKFDIEWLCPEPLIS